MPAPASRRRLARYAAPAAFLLGVTIAVLLVRAGLGGSGPAHGPLGPVRTQTATTALATTTSSATTGVTTAAASPFYTVQRGDTFGSIAAKEGTTVAELERLNPGVSSNALQIGQKLRVR